MILDYFWIASNFRTIAWFVILAWLLSIVGSGFLADAMNKNVPLWMVTGGAFPIIAPIVLLLLTSSEPIEEKIARALAWRLAAGRGGDGERPSAGTASASPDAVTEARWRALLDVDDEIAAVHREMEALGPTYAREFAETYRLLGDRSYLGALRWKILTRAEQQRAERQSLAQAEHAAGDDVRTVKLLETYETRLAANGGRDPRTGMAVVAITPYPGPIKAFAGGIRVDLEGGGMVFCTEFIQRAFGSEDELRRWANL